MTAMATATISDTAARASTWERVFGVLTVPILSPVTEKARVHGLGVKDVYRLNWRLLDSAAQRRLVEHLALEFRCTQVEARRVLETEGLPLLADDCMVTFDARMVL